MTAPERPDQGRGPGAAGAGAEVRDDPMTVPDDPTSDRPAAAGVGAGDEPAVPGDEAGAETGAAGDGVPRSARLFVALLLALLLVPGVIGFDAWPLTGWRLFSVSRDADQIRWVVEATGADGAARVVSLEELPLRYRHAEWPMAELPGATDDRRRAVCLALLEPVLDVEPGTVEVTIARDHARLVHRDGEWVTEHDLEPFHSCTAGERDGAGGSS